MAITRYMQVGAPLTKDVLEKALEGLTEREQKIIKAQVSKIDIGLKAKKLADARREEALTGKKKKIMPTGFGESSGLELVAKLGSFINEMNERDPEGVRALMKSRRGF